MHANTHANVSAALAAGGPAAVITVVQPKKHTVPASAAGEPETSLRNVWYGVGGVGVWGRRGGGSVGGADAAVAAAVVIPKGK